MGLVAAMAWVAVGVVAGVALVRFWEDISQWLKNTAANAVEKVLGYGARNRMQKATCRVDRLMDKVRNTAVIYTKKDRLSTMFDKTTICAQADYTKVDKDVLKELQKNKELVQQFECRQ